MIENLITDSYRKLNSLQNGPLTKKSYLETFLKSAFKIPYF